MPSDRVSQQTRRRPLSQQTARRISRVPTSIQGRVMFRSRIVRRRRNRIDQETAQKQIAPANRLRKMIARNPRSRTIVLNNLGRALIQSRTSRRIVLKQTAPPLLRSRTIIPQLRSRTIGLRTRLRVTGPRPVVRPPHPQIAGRMLQVNLHRKASSRIVEWNLQRPIIVRRRYSPTAQHRGSLTGPRPLAPSRTVINRLHDP